MHAKSLRSIAQLICGNAAHGGHEVVEGYRPGQSFQVPSHYRKAPEIKQLFADAAVGPVEDIEALFSASKDSQRSKFDTTLACLQEFCDSSDGIKPEMDRLLCDLAAPREYAKNPQLAPQVLKFLNDELAFEGFAIQLKHGVRPVLSAIGQESAVVSGVGATPAFASAINDPAMVAILNSRWRELDLCHSSNAHLASMILLGGIMEGLIQSKALEKPTIIQAAPSMRNHPKKVEDWSLEELIKGACECGWLKQDRQKNFHHARDIRNLVHPHRELKGQAFTPDISSVRIGIEVVRGAVADLANA